MYPYVSRYSKEMVLLDDLFRTDQERDLSWPFCTFRCDRKFFELSLFHSEIKKKRRKENLDPTTTGNGTGGKDTLLKKASGFGKG